MSKQYVELGRRLLEEGTAIYNKRTDKNCHTIINADLEYDLSDGGIEIVNTRKSYWKAAVAEILGYILGLDNSDDFRKIGTKTWDANAGAKSWLESDGRQMASGSIFLSGDDVEANEYNGVTKGYMGRVYGVQGRNWVVPEQFVDTDTVWDPSITVDQFRKIYDDLRNGEDDRGEILMFWNPGEHQLGCLRPCMYSHHFSLVGDTLHLHSTQRSADGPLGLNFNMVQVQALLYIMAAITGNRPGKVYHKIVNAHVYDDQLETFKEEMAREPLPNTSKFYIDPNLTSLEVIEQTPLEDLLSLFNVEGYESHGPLKHPFTV